jgi:hypothetical protein
MKRWFKKKVSRFRYYFRAGVRSERKLAYFRSDFRDSHNTLLRYLKSLVKVQNQHSNWVERLGEIGLDTVKAQNRIDKQVIERVDEVVEQMKLFNKNFHTLEESISKIYDIYNSFHAVKAENEKEKN